MQGHRCSHSTLAFGPLYRGFFIPGRSHAAENWSSACWKACWKDASSIISSEKSKRLIPAVPNCDTHVDSGVTTAVVLNRGTRPQGARALTRPTTWKEWSLNLRINTLVFTAYLKTWNKRKKNEGKRGRKKITNYWSIKLFKELLTAHIFVESNSNGERSWFNSPDTETNFWAGTQWLDDQ